MATRTFWLFWEACSVLFLKCLPKKSYERYEVFAILAAFIALKIEERSNGGVEEGTDVDWI